MVTKDSQGISIVSPMTLKRLRKWWSRESARTILKKARDQARLDESSEAENAHMSPPGDQLVELRHIFLVEAFGPSEYANLAKGLENYPGSSDTISRYRITNTFTTRSPTEVSAFDLGIISRDNPLYVNDNSLPKEFFGVQTWKVHISESLTILVVGLTLNSEYGKMKAVQESPYKNFFRIVRIRHFGSGAKYRFFKPFSRPKQGEYQIEQKISGSWENKTNEWIFEISKYTNLAERWFSQYFMGYFASNVKAPLAIPIFQTLNFNAFVHSSATKWILYTPLRASFPVWREASESMLLKSALISDPEPWPAWMSQAVSQFDTDDSVNFSWMTQFTASNKELVSWIAVKSLMSSFLSEVTIFRDLGSRHSFFKRNREFRKKVKDYLTTRLMDISLITSEFVLHDRATLVPGIDPYILTDFATGQGSTTNPKDLQTTNYEESKKIAGVVRETNFTVTNAVQISSQYELGTENLRMGKLMGLLTVVLTLLTVALVILTIKLTHT